MKTTPLTPNNDIAIKVRGMIVDLLGLQGLPIEDNTEFYNDLGVDSLDFIELMVSVEKEFNLTIEDTQYDKLKTVGALVNYVAVNAHGVADMV
jgi:acyl carrier protein